MQNQVFDPSANTEYVLGKPCGHVRVSCRTQLTFISKVHLWGYGPVLVSAVVHIPTYMKSAWPNRLTKGRVSCSAWYPDGAVRYYWMCRFLSVESGGHRTTFLRSSSERAFKFPFFSSSIPLSMRFIILPRSPSLNAMFTSFPSSQLKRVVYGSCTAFDKGAVFDTFLHRGHLVYTRFCSRAATFNLGLP
jgi:hypothetical protein